MWRSGIPALHIWVSAVRLKLWVLTPTNPMRLQALLRSLSAMKRVRAAPGRPPGNKNPGDGWWASSSWANPGWMSTTRVLSFPFVVDFLKINIPPMRSVVWSASASDTRQPVNKQMPNSALSRAEENPSVNSRFNSSWVRTFPCPLPLTFIVK